MPCQTILSLARRPRSGDVNRACPVSERTLLRLPKPANSNDDATGQPVARMQSLNHGKHIQCFHSFQNASLTTLSEITHTVCFCNDSPLLLTETVSGVDKPALSHFVSAAPRVDRADNETARWCGITACFRVAAALQRLIIARLRRVLGRIQADCQEMYRPASLRPGR